MIYIHLTILALTILVILFTDGMGLLWILGKKKVLSKKLFMWLHKAVWLGLIGMIVSGAIMAFPYKEFLITNPLFGGKIFFVGLLVVNAILIGKHMELAFTHSFKELKTKEKLALLISGAISTGAWIGAFTLAKILF